MIYILYDGLTYNTRGYFASCVGARKNESNEQNVPAYYMSNYRIRDLLFHCKMSLQFCHFPYSLCFILVPRAPRFFSLRRKRGSPIGLAGCGIWLIFVAIFGMRAKNKSGSGNFNYERERDFVFLRGRDARIAWGKVAGYGISIFTWLHESTKRASSVQMDPLRITVSGFN